MRSKGGAVVLALGLAFLPAVNDVCDIGCDLGGPAPLSTAGSSTASCPLHSDMPAAPTDRTPHDPVKGPDQCGHDHVSIRTAEAGSTIATPTAMLLANTLELAPMALGSGLTPVVQNRPSPLSQATTLSVVLRV